MAVEIGFQPIAFQSAPQAFQAGAALFLFGHVVISIPSQLPVQPVRASLIEGSAFEFTATYFDIFGDPGVPVSVFYQVLERASWFQIAGWTPISPGFSNTIFIPSSSNMVVNNAHILSEAHVIQLQITDGAGNVFYRSQPFDVLRDLGVEAGEAPANTPAFMPGAFEAQEGFQTGITGTPQLP